MAFGSPKIWLDVPFVEKDAASAAGAKWDGVAKRWFFPGKDTSRVARWLPANARAPSAQDGSLSLSVWLRRAEDAVRLAYGEPLRVVVELAEVSVSGNGHFYADIIETNENGELLAKCKAALWASRASSVLANFQKMTGGFPSRGMKVLMLLQAKFDARWGFSAEILDIDASWSLGEMERKRREIMLRLQAEGLTELNKLHQVPREFTRIAVIAPEGAAGLGDFRKEADMLQHFGLCEFEYAFSKFQGEGAATNITDLLCEFANKHDSLPFDALVIVRGGGAKSDLAWLDDFELSRSICLAPFPVFVGVGHERDSVVPDDVACKSFDTPSKVVLFIMENVTSNAVRAADNWNSVVSGVLSSLDLASSNVQNVFSDIGHLSERVLSDVEKGAERMLSDIRASSLSILDKSQYMSDVAFTEIVAGSPERTLEKGWTEVSISGISIVSKDAFDKLPLGTNVSIRFKDGVSNFEKGQK